MRARRKQTERDVGSRMRGGGRMARLVRGLARAAGDYVQLTTVSAPVKPMM